MDTVPYQTKDLQPAGDAELVAPGVWLLAGRPRHAFNVYLIGDTLVDSGTRHAARRIARQTGRLPLSAHVVTHGHLDHMGSSHAVCEAFGIPLLCGAEDVAAVESGGLSELAEKPLPVRIERRLLGGPGHPVARTLEEGDEIAGFTVLHTPGHTPGHVALWRERDRVLVLGDVLFNLRPATGKRGLQLPPRFLTRDAARNLESARRLAQLEPRVICFGHGPVLRDGGQFADFVAKASVDDDA
jgi:hydroxyacylglutathione hydrolase